MCYASPPVKINNTPLVTKIRSGPNRPAAEIGVWIFQIGQILCAYYAYFGTHGLLKLVVRRLEFHRNSGFFQANSSRLFWPSNGLRGQI